MGMESAFRELTGSLGRLRQSVEELGTVVDDVGQPKGKTVRLHLAPQLSDSVQDVLGWAEEALVLAHHGAETIRQQIDLHGARRDIAGCQEKFHLLTSRWSAEITSDGRRAELIALREGRRTEWREWATAVLESLPIVEQRLAGVRQALLGCWQEMAERAGLTNVTVQNTNIGQQVSPV